MNADGSNQTKLTSTGPNFYPSYSPGGTSIGFTSFRDGNTEVYTMDANGMNQTRLTNNAADDFFPVYSPDGSQIAFTSRRDGNYEIYVMDANGANPTRLTNNTLTDIFPSWALTDFPPRSATYPVGRM